MTCLAPIAVTLGDPAGIGPEITAKAWRALKTEPDHAFAVLAPNDPAILARFADIPTKIMTDITQTRTVFADALPIYPLTDVRVFEPITPGAPSPNHAPMITGSIEQAVHQARSGAVSAVVTNPISKDVLYAAGFTHPGHTEYLGALTQTPAPVMMLSAGGLSVALVTIHLSLQDAIHRVDQATIIQTATILHTALIQDFGIPAPRIAMTGLNPHAGENGALGTEEMTILNPAAKILRGRGINISDARPADTLFHTEARAGYDAVLAMYHDQGLIPVKTLDFHGGVNITLGLPIVRTSPDHGTAFDIAGKNQARPDSLVASIKAARQIALHRAAHAG